MKHSLGSIKIIIASLLHNVCNRCWLALSRVRSRRVYMCVCLIIESDVLILRKQPQSKYQPVIIYRRRRHAAHAACLFNSAFCAKHDRECDLTIGAMYSSSFAFCSAACGIISKAADAPALRLWMRLLCTFCEGRRGLLFYFFVHTNMLDNFGALRSALAKINNKNNNNRNSLQIRINHRLFQRFSGFN